MTIELPDDLVARLKPERERLAEIIERGLDSVRIGSSALGKELVSFFARGPGSREIVAYRPSTEACQRASELLEKNRDGSLTSQDRTELEEMAALNHWFTRIKAEARLHLGQEDGPHR